CGHPFKGILAAEGVQQLGELRDFSGDITRSGSANPQRFSNPILAQQSCRDEGNNLVEMIKENLVAERVAIETYRDMVRYFADRGPTTRIIWSGFWQRRKSTPMTCMTSSSRMRAGRCSKNRIRPIWPAARVRRRLFLWLLARSCPD